MGKTREQTWQDVCDAVTGKVAAHSAMKATVDAKMSRDIWAAVRY